MALDRATQSRTFTSPTLSRIAGSEWEMETTEADHLNVLVDGFYSLRDIETAEISDIIKVTGPTYLMGMEVVGFGASDEINTILRYVTDPSIGTLGTFWEATDW